MVAELISLQEALYLLGGVHHLVLDEAGKYDIVCVCEAPDGETIAKWALAVGSKGAVRTETLRAYTEDEYRKIISALPWGVVELTLSESPGTPLLNIYPGRVVPHVQS